MRSKKFFASLFAALLVFSCSLLLSSRVYADDVLFNIFVPEPGNSVTTDGAIAVGYTPSYDFRTLSWNVTMVPGYKLPMQYLTSSPYDKNLIGGKTMYLGWFFRYTAGSITNTDPRFNVRSAGFQTAGPNSYTDISYTIISSAGNNNYNYTGYNCSKIACVRFTLPDDSYAFEVSYIGWKNTGSVNATINYVVFPVCYLADWGSDVSSALDSILAELLDQGRTLDSILAVLNSIYTEATKISSDTSAIRSLMVTCASKLTSADSHLANIENTVDDIYYLLYESLSEESDDLSDEAAELGDSISQRINAEQYWNDKNTLNYNAIGLDNFTFSNGILSGLTLVGTLFSNIWNALGESTIPIIFALTLGVALVVIGRIGRSSGGGKSSKKDDK